MGGVERIHSLDRASSDLANRVAPSVVEIRAGSGVGAGTIWRAGGLIVTNDHVVAHERAEGPLAAGRRGAGQVVARDLRNDLAVISIGLGGLPAAEARIGTVRPGELVLAVGHPFGVRYSVALGIVSTAAASIQWGEGIERPLIRADVTIGPGNSG